MKKFMITKSPVIEIQNIVMNPKSSPIKLISKQFLIKYVSSKIKWQKDPHNLDVKDTE